MYRIAINGYGRIGQCVVRALYEGYRKQFKLVAINDLADLETMAYLTRYDTTHGRFKELVKSDGNNLQIANDDIYVSRHRSVENLNWQSLNIDLLLECTGSFKDRMTAMAHIKKGAPRLLFSHPAESDVDKTVVYGINQDEIKPAHTIISNASCTTNCIVPVLKILDEALEVAYGSMTTIHSVMNDQPIIDAYHHTDLRLTRSALQSIIPIDTQLNTGIDRLLPHLKGCFTTNAVRVPTINVSCIDLCVQVKKHTTIQSINQLLTDRANGDLKGILGVTMEPHASIDFNHDTRSCIVDLTQTKVSEGQLVKLLCWFDNEWAFSNRMLDVAAFWLNRALDGQHRT